MLLSAVYGTEARLSRHVQLFPRRTQAMEFEQSEPDDRLIEPRPFRRAVMGDGAARRLADQPCIFGKRPSPMPGWPLHPCPPPLCEFIGVDQQIHAARAGIDPDPVASAHQRQRAADERFRRDIADAYSA